MKLIKIGSKSFDLDGVASLSEEEYDTLCLYAKQLDAPEVEIWLAALEKARGSSKATAEEKPKPKK